MDFAGFRDEAFEFYEGLAADNSKAYWIQHKATYEESVRAPMMALLETLEPEFGPGKLYRPYRDVRFSKDKSPYKTHQGGHAGSGYHVGIDADGLMVAGGMYVAAPPQLARYRGAVDADGPGARLDTIVNELRTAGFEIAGDRLKTRPRGVPDDHPRLHLLRYRSLYAHQGWPPQPWVDSPEALDRIRDAWRRLRPIVEWTAEYVGTDA